MRTGLFCLLVVAAIAGASAYTLGNAGEPLEVTMLVLSGEKNPTWTLDGTNADTLRLVHKAIALHSTPTGSHRVLGYRGFVVTTQAGQTTLISGNIHEEMLLITSGRSVKALSDEVYKHALHEIHALEKAKESAFFAGLNEACGAETGKACFTGLSCVCPEPSMCRCADDHLEMLHSADNSGSCDNVVGPDTVPAYGPDKDDGGCFIKMAPDNNCYDYGNDIVTNTFAQPGRGTGHKWDSDTCDSVRAAAERDGLKWLGQTLPDSDPEEGHYVALLIWPNTNFHWVRKDSNGKWSHKPGGTPVKNTDNGGNLITDPSKQDFSPWSQFCGYMQTVPSKVKIN